VVSILITVFFKNCQIEDVVTSGLSVLETVAKLDKVKLVVKNVVAFLDREQGAADNLTNKGLNLVAAVKVRSSK
jgi:orotate phosphoribosyltransferase